MFNFLTKKAYLLFYVAINGLLIFSGTNAEPPLRDIPLNLQPPIFQNQIIRVVQPEGQPQQAAQSTYLVDLQNQNVQIEVPADSYLLTNNNNYGAPALSYQVADKRFPNNNNKNRPKPFTLTVTNVTTALRGSLDLPYGQRLAMGLTYPPMAESSYPKQSSNSYGYGQGSYNNVEDNNVKFSGEPEINFGNIVIDTFVLKERHSRAPSSSGNPSPTVSSTSDDRASILNGILSTVIENGPSTINISSQTPQQRETEGIHTPGDLIAREIPFNGEMNFGALENLTEFLIDDASKFRPTRGQSSKEQVPMFVAVQFSTVGRNKLKTYDEGGQKNSKIHVVLGHKHFAYKNIKNLNELYDYVNEDYETYQPTGDFGSNYFNAQPKFRISKVVIDLIIEFVHFSWKAHQDVYTATEARGKDITKRVVKVLRQSSKNKPRFRPNKFQEDTPNDFFTWAYTNTLGYRTLV